MPSKYEVTRGAWLDRTWTMPNRARLRTKAKQESVTRWPTPGQKARIEALLAERRVTQHDRSVMKTFLLPSITNKGITRTISYLQNLPMKETSLTSTS